MRLQKPKMLPVVPISLALLACGGGDSLATDAPWEPDQVTLRSPSSTEAAVARSPVGGGCIQIAEFECVAPDSLIEECGEGEAADVLVDEAGNIVDVLCLPPDAVTISPAQLADGEIPQEANHTAVDFTGTTYEDDLVVDANGVVLYGDDPDDAILEGDLEVAGNNTVVRGLTIDGDVSVSLNNTKFVFCRITGDVTIEFNNTEIIGCEIFGNVTITGNNSVFSGNLIAGAVEITGRNTRCGGQNYSFVDENADSRVDDDEVGAPLDLDCSPAGRPEEGQEQDEAEDGRRGPPAGL